MTGGAGGAGISAAGGDGPKGRGWPSRRAALNKGGRDGRRVAQPCRVAQARGAASCCCRARPCRAPPSRAEPRRARRAAPNGTESPTMKSRRGPARPPPIVDPISIHTCDNSDKSSNAGFEPPRTLLVTVHCGGGGGAGA